MKLPGNPTLDKHTKQWTVQRIRTKQGAVRNHRINRGKPGMSASRRRAYRRFAHRVTVHLNYSRASSIGTGV